MRTFFEGVEELLDHDPEYQETKEKQDALSEEIDEKIDEHYEKWHEIDRLQERQAEIENEIDSIKSKAFNEKIEQKIDELAQYSQTEAQEYHAEFQGIKEEEEKEARKKVVYQEQDFSYSPPDPSIESVKDVLYGAVEKSIEKYQTESEDVDEEMSEEIDEWDEVEEEFLDQMNEADDIQ